MLHKEKDGYYEMFKMITVSSSLKVMDLQESWINNYASHTGL